MGRRPIAFQTVDRDLIRKKRPSVSRVVKPNADISVWQVVDFEVVVLPIHKNTVIHHHKLIVKMSDEIKYSTSIIDHLMIPDFLRWVVWATSASQLNVDLRTYASTFVSACQGPIRNHRLGAIGSWPKTISAPKLLSFFNETYDGLDDLIKIISTERSNLQSSVPKIQEIGKQFLMEREFDDETKHKWIKSNEAVVATSQSKTEAIERLIAFMVSDLFRSKLMTYDQINEFFITQCQKSVRPHFVPAENSTSAPSSLETTAGDIISNEYIK